MSVPYLVLAVVTLLSTVPSLIFSAAELKHRDPEVRRVARYLTVRSGALLLVAVAPLVYPSVGWLAAVAVTMTIVQAGDAVLGLIRRQVVYIVGPAVTALATVAALAWLLSTQPL